MALFMSPHEFLLVRSGDPRIQPLREQAAREAADRSLGGYTRLVEYEVSSESAGNGGGRWLQGLFAVLSFLSFFCYLSVPLSLGAGVVRLDVERRCVEWDRGSLAYSWNQYAGTACGAALLLSALSVAAVVARRACPRFPVVLGRHTVHTWRSRPQVVVFGLGAIIASLLTGNFTGAVYIALTVTLAGAFDFVLFFVTNSRAVRALALGLAISFLGSWLFQRLEAARLCSEVGSTQPLDAAIREGFAVAAVLVYNISLAGIVLSRAARPRLPVGKRPRSSFSTTCDDPLTDGGAYRVHYGRYGLHVNREGSDGEMHARSDPLLTHGWRIEGRRSRALAWVFACVVLTMVTAYVARTLNTIGRIVLTANMARRCFVTPSSIFFAIDEFAQWIILGGFVMVMATLTWQTVRLNASAIGAFRSMAGYAYRLWRSRPVFVISAVVATVVSVFSVEFVAALVPASVVLVPFVDANTTTLSRIENRAMRYGVTSMAVALLPDYIISSLVVPNGCDLTEKEAGRFTTGEYIAFSISTGARAVWCLQLVKMVAQKMQDGRAPFFNFLLTPGVAFDNAWMDAALGTRVSNVKLDRKRSSSFHQAKSIEMQSRSSSLVVNPVHI
jgi:hypothetical protein